MGKNIPVSIISILIISLLLLPSISNCERDVMEASLDQELPITEYTEGGESTSQPGTLVVSPTDNAGGGNATSFYVPVVGGWNLVSVPLLMANGTLPNALEDLDGDTAWDKALWYSPSGGQNRWKEYCANWPAALDSLSTVGCSMGLWLNVTSAGDGLIHLEGNLPGNVTIPLKAGWNLVGYPSQTDGSYCVGALKAETGATAVEGFDQAAVYKTKLLDDGRPMKRGEGYWVYSPADSTWSVPNNDGFNGPVHNLNKNTYYATIQAGVDDANPKDVIVVASGTFYEAVTISKSLTLRGVAKATTFIQANSSNGISISGKNWVNISGFTVRAAGCGLQASSCNYICVQNCTFKLSAEGVRMGISRWCTVKYCDLENNTGYGVDLLGGYSSCQYCQVFHNNFWFNNGATTIYSSPHIQAYDTDMFYNNNWTYGDPIGNFWRDWTAPDANGDGIVDSPYVVGFLDDWAPRTAPWH